VWWRFVQQRRSQQPLSVDPPSAADCFSAALSCDFIDSLFSANYKSSSIKTIVTSVGWLARLFSLPPPATLRPVSIALAGVAAQRPLMPRYSTVFDLGAFLRSVIDSLGDLAQQPLARWPERQLRDTAIVFARAFLADRSSDLARIITSTVRRAADGTVSFCLLPPKHQRDRGVASRPFYLAAQPSARLCPASLLWEYTRRVRARIAGLRDPPRCLFLSLVDDTALSSERVAAVCKALLDAAPADVVEPGVYGAHALKAASVTFLRRRNHAFDDIAQLNHASSSAVLRNFYDRSSNHAAMQADIAAALTSPRPRVPATSPPLSAARALVSRRAASSPSSSSPSPSPPTSLSLSSSPPSSPPSTVSRARRARQQPRALSSPPQPAPVRTPAPSRVPATPVRSSARIRARGGPPSFVQFGDA
jgi:hypothetical protein